ncbi:MAG: PaaI family thioesterase [Planctomycetota bacterium]|jgi:acyl-coenzyme A thioesterase PaaI-like protein
MNVEELPFNKLIGLKDSVQSVELDCAEKHMNHVGTVHATVIFGIAEACSGKFIIEHLSQDFPEGIAVTRGADIRYRNPGTGQIEAKVTGCEPPVESVIERLRRRGIAKISVEVEVSSVDGTLATSHFEWFLKNDE